MKKSTAKEKLNKKQKINGILAPEEAEIEPGHVVTEDLDPDIVKVLTKPTKKPKTGVDATDYIPELERGSDPDSGTDEF